MERPMSTSEERFSRRVRRLVDRFEDRLDFEEIELVLQRHAQETRARRAEAAARADGGEEREHEQSE